jgi:hypothetical protein
MTDRCLHDVRAMVADQLQSYVPRSPASLDTIVRRAGLQTKPQALQVSRVLRELQARAAVVGAPLTLAVDDTVHLRLDEALLTSALTTLLDYAAEHGAGALVLRLSSEEPGVVLELEIDGTHLASKIWQELQSSAPHSPTLGRAAQAFHEMQAELELQHTGEASASVVILLPVQRVSDGVAAE